MLKQKGLKFKMLLGATVISLIPIFTIGSISYYFAKQAILEEIKSKLVMQVENIKNSISWDIQTTLNVDEKNKIIDRHKEKIRNEVVGKTGYMYILDSNVNLVVRKKLDDGINEGDNLKERLPFLKNIVKEKDTYLVYELKGRKKVVASRYLDKLDWYIVAGSYFEDFTGPLNEIRNSIFLVSLLTLLFVIPFVVFFANKITDSLKEATAIISENTSNNLTIATSMNEAGHELSNSTVEQAASIEETSASLYELITNIEKNVESAKKASETTMQINNVANEGLVIMNRLVDAMVKIKSSNDRIQELVKIISEIGDKTAIIDEIVFQTKLLSFNASVEAERAGEHGRGFAVVAQEVGNLARLSGSAALDISSIVQKSLDSARKITDENRSKVDEGNKVVQETGEILKKVSQASEYGATCVKEISVSSIEQMEGIRNIKTAVDHIDSNLQKATIIAKDAADVGTQMLESSTALKNLTEQINYLVYGT